MAYFAKASQVGLDAPWAQDDAYLHLRVIVVSSHTLLADSQRIEGLAIDIKIGAKIVFYIQYITFGAVCTVSIEGCLYAVWINVFASCPADEAIVGHTDLAESSLVVDGLAIGVSALTT